MFISAILSGRKESVCACACECVFLLLLCLGRWPPKLNKVREVEYLSGKPPRKSQVLQEMTTVTQLLAAFPSSLN